MRSILLAAIATFVTASAFAGEKTRCTASLLTNMKADKKEFLWMNPNTKLVSFDYETGTDKVVYYGLKKVQESTETTAHYRLEFVNNAADAVFKALFSTIHNGKTLPEGLATFEFGSPTDFESFWGPNDATEIFATAMAKPEPDVNAHAVFTCVKIKK